MEASCVLSILGTAQPLILLAVDPLLVLWCVCVGDVSLVHTAHLPLPYVLSQAGAWCVSVRRGWGSLEVEAGLWNGYIMSALPQGNWALSGLP